jgi:hypothetical protein
MRLPSPPLLPLLILLSYASLLPSATATRLIETHALDIIKPGNFSATLFSAVFTPDNTTAALRLVGDTKITGNVTARILLFAYGYQATNETLNPCKVKALKGFCPMNAGPLELTMSNIPIAKKTLGSIPSIAYSIPDLDAIVKISVKSLKTGEETTVVQAALSNGKTVYQAAVGWIVAVFAGIGLIVSVVVPIIWGYSDAAVRLAGYMFSLFGFVQAQAMLGMLAVPMPPIVQSWTQNFQWSMGVVHADFLEKVCTWYQRSTGGTADQLMETMSTHMVHVLRKRDEGTALAKRADSETSTSTDVVVRGLSRVAFRAGIEQTNLFLTAFILFGFITVITVVLISLWKAVQVHPRSEARCPIGTVCPRASCIESTSWPSRRSASFVSGSSRSATPPPKYFSPSSPFFSSSVPCYGPLSRFSSHGAALWLCIATRSRLYSPTRSPYTNTAFYTYTTTETRHISPR